MELIFGLLAIFFVMLGLAAFGFAVAVQPIWGIVDVAVSKEHSGGAKAAVILLTLLLLGPVMTFLYACFGTTSRLFRRVSIAAVVISVLCFFATIGLAAISPTVRNGVDEYVDVDEFVRARPVEAPVANIR